MNDRPGVDPEQPEQLGAPAGRSRYEDFDLAEIQAAQQRAPRQRGRRTPTITVAAVILAVSGLQPLILVIAFRPGGATGVAVAAWGVLCIVAAALVATLQPIGRPLGIAVGCVGVVIGVATARSSAVNGLIGIALTGFVIYACAVSGPSFRRG
jgi:hypothetical protein